MLANRFTEKDVRNWLDENGYFGRSAIFHELELHAIKRPGWLQIFRFYVKVKSRDEQWTELFGVVRDDERERSQANRTRVFIFDDAPGQREKLDEMSEGLITSRRPYETGDLKWPLLVCTACIVVLVLIVSMFAE